MQPYDDDDAMARAMGEVDSPLYDPTYSRPSQASSAQPRKPSMQEQYAQFKQKNEKYTVESVKAYGEWWDARMKGMNKADHATFVSLMTVGNGFCRKQADKCLNGLFPKYEHYPEFLTWLDTQGGDWGKEFRSYLMSHAMPTMVAKVHAEGGFKSKSKSMRRRRNRRKSKKNKRRRHN
jgi:hypothetical protein